MTAKNNAEPTPNITDAIKRYLRTGDADMDARAWPGDFMERGRRQDADLGAALVAEVRRLAKGHTHEPVPADVGIELTRAKVQPMVRGLFARAEQDVVLATLDKSVVYVTSDTIASIILNHKWDRSRRDLANMYLLSVGAKLLGKKAARIVGMSEVEYALRDQRRPMGVADWETQLVEKLPDALKGSLPSIEEIEAALAPPRQRTTTKRKKS